MSIRSAMSGKDSDRATNTDANVEQNTGNAPVAENAIKAFDSQVRITFHHIRNRLADIDGLSGKAAIDGIVEAGILTDDSPKQVTEIINKQTKGKDEKTVIIIERCGDE